MKKIPMRQCVVSRERLEKKDLIRIVKDKEGNVSVDLTGKLNGKGAYIKKDSAVLEKAKKSKVLNKVLEIDVPESIYEELAEIINK